MLSLLFLGFLIGMRHALEADHIAAVSSLVARTESFSRTVRMGAAWGLGHTITLFLFGSIVILMDTVMPEKVAFGLEVTVGFMLVYLGFDVLRRVIRDRVHFHSHSHGDDEHFHAHSHRGEGEHEDSEHSHSHDKRFPIRALLVGLMHGMAGSAALILLTLETIKSPWMGMLYMLLFGVGSMIGMALLTFVIAIPLRASAQRLTWFHNTLQVVIGMFTVGLGLNLVLPVFQI